MIFGKSKISFYVWACQQSVLSMDLCLTSSTVCDCKCLSIQGYFKICQPFRIKNNALKASIAHPLPNFATLGKGLSMCLCLKLVRYSAQYLMYYQQIWGVWSHVVIISCIVVNAVNVVSKLKVLYPLFLVILCNKLKYTKSIKIFATNTSQNSVNYPSSVY